MSVDRRKKQSTSAFVVIAAYVFILGAVIYAGTVDEEGLGTGEPAIAVVFIVLWLGLSVAAGLIVARSWVLLVPLLSMAAFVIAGPSAPQYYDNEYWPVNLAFIGLFSTLFVATGLVGNRLVLRRRRSGKDDPGPGSPDHRSDPGLGG